MAHFAPAFLVCTGFAVEETPGGGDEIINYSLDLYRPQRPTVDTPARSSHYSMFYQVVSFTPSFTPSSPNGPTTRQNACIILPHTFYQQKEDCVTQPPQVSPSVQDFISPQHDGTAANTVKIKDNFTQNIAYENVNYSSTSHPETKETINTINSSPQTMNHGNINHRQQNQRQPPSAKPTLPCLYSFTSFHGEIIDVIQRIAPSYLKFGIILLIDKYGDIIKSFYMEHRGNPKQITVEILRMWLKGRGRQPLSWETLIAVLREIDETLAKEIEQNLALWRANDTRQHITN